MVYGLVIYTATNKCNVPVSRQTTLGNTTNVPLFKDFSKAKAVRRSKLIYFSQVILFTSEMYEICQSE